MSAQRELIIAMWRAVRCLINKPEIDEIDHQAIKILKDAILKAEVE